MYFCMKNSPATEDDFREDLLTVIDHYQVKKFSSLKFKEPQFVNTVNTIRQLCNAFESIKLS